jgi:endonuclease YncB( thermonuclease family)
MGDKTQIKNKNLNLNFYNNNNIQTNFKEDIKLFFKNNFVDSYKGYVLVFGILLYKSGIIYKFSKQNRNFIRNNKSIPIDFIEKNKVIKVKPVGNSLDKNGEMEFTHIPSKFLFYFTKKVAIEENISDIGDKNIKIRLAGIDTISKEGIEFISQKVLKINESFLQFHSIDENKQVSAWILIKNYEMTKNLNLNIFLIRNGLAKKSSSVKCNLEEEFHYDENIYYYLSDLSDAEIYAKTMGLGLWSEINDPNKSPLLKETYLNKFSIRNLFASIRRSFTQKKWEYLILKK